jgi:hypothetical protein
MVINAAPNYSNQRNFFFGLAWMVSKLKREICGLKPYQAKLGEHAPRVARRFTGIRHVLDSGR